MNNPSLYACVCTPLFCRLDDGRLEVMKGKNGTLSDMAKAKRLQEIDSNIEQAIASANQLSIHGISFAIFLPME